MSKHLIHRQVLDLRYADERRAKTAMDQWGERYEKDWLPVIEEVLDDLDQEGKWYRLEKVELDLGKIRENLEPELLRKKLKEALKNQLLRQIPDLQKGKESLKNQNPGQPQDHWKLLELLIYLLQYGRKPWWASSSKKEGIRTLIKKFISEKDKVFLVWIQSESFTGVMVERLINHLETKEIQRMTSLAFSEKQKESQIIVQSLVSVLSPEITPKTELEKLLENRIAEAFLVSETEINHPITQWFKTWLVNSKTTFRPTQEALLELLALLIPLDFFQKSQTKILEKVWSKWVQSSIYRNPVRPISLTKNNLTREKEHFFNLIKNGKGRLSESSPKNPKPLQNGSSRIQKDKKNLFEKLELEETFPISNSGLVLAAPFLPYFFKGLGLVENKSFVSKEAQNRGALLIQALLDDSYFYEESDLLLNKIICGIDPSEPIEVNFLPTDIEKEEIQNLLDSMVARWTALRSTSGASMAKGFFPREGSLRRVEIGFQLTIPRISIDILLNRLPWTIGIIKLPWMEETLYTEW